MLGVGVNCCYLKCVLAGRLCVFFIFVVWLSEASANRGLLYCNVGGVLSKMCMDLRGVVCVA